MKKIGFPGLQIALVVVAAILLSLSSLSCSTDQPIPKTKTIILPLGGYQWPTKERPYWPTEGWRRANLADHGINPEKMALAAEFARQDYLARALLVVKDGYLVHEKYYGNGGVGQSTNLWSVTKSFVSALVGIAKGRKLIDSCDRKMVDLLPQYPDFGDITLSHVLTQRTGLDWTEEGQPWVDWIHSKDWVEAALAKGRAGDPGKRFKYSSANSQFLSTMLQQLTGKTPGQFARELLFEPLGITFVPRRQKQAYTLWDEYKIPLVQSWHQSPRGIETAGFGLCLTARDMAKFGYLYLNRGQWAGKQIIPRDWVEQSTRDQVTDVYGRYSYGYHWWLTLVAGQPSFLASGFGGQIIGVVPALDLVVVLKYEAGNPIHSKTGSPHDDMHLFALVVNSCA